MRPAFASQFATMRQVTAFDPRLIPGKTPDPLFRKKRQKLSRHKIAAGATVTFARRNDETLFVGFRCMAVLSQQTAAVQDLTGTWQGMLRANGPDQRTVIKISRDDGEASEGALYRIDQGPGYAPITGTARGGNITLSIPAIPVTYTGKLDSNGNSISGTWTQDRSTQLLNLIRANSETAWTIPADPRDAPKMPSDAVPTYEVATIKASRPDEVKTLMRQGRRF